MKKVKVGGAKMNVPEINDTYWYVAVSPAYGNFIVQTTTWKNYGSDKRRLVKGNLYFTEEEANALAIKLNEMLEDL